MIEAILSRLEKYRANGIGKWIGCCPSHDDSSPSLSLQLCDDGRILIHCFAGCEVKDVVAALGLELSDLFPPCESIDGYQPIQQDYMKAKAIDDLRGEVTFILATLYWMQAGRAPTENYRLRLESSDTRIQAACRCLGIKIRNHDVGEALNQWLAESV